MQTYEKDLELAGEYLKNKTASAEQLNDLVIRLLAYTEVLPSGPDYASAVSRLRLQAAQLKVQVRTLQSSLLDDVQRITNLRNDRRLADALEAAPSSISRIRAGYLTVGATLIIRIHELTGWSVRHIKARLNMPCLPSLVNQQEVPSE